VISKIQFVVVGQIELSPSLIEEGEDKSVGETQTNRAIHNTRSELPLRTPLINPKEPADMRGVLVNNQQERITPFHKFYAVGKKLPPKRRSVFFTKHFH